MATDKQHKKKTVSKEREAEQPFGIQMPASVAINEVDEYNQQAVQQMFATALNPIHLQSVTGRGLNITAREFEFKNCLITNVFVMEFFFTCGIYNASGSIHNQII